MKLLVAGVVVLLALSPAACGTGYAHWGTAPNDANGMVQADSTCDLDRATDDMGSHCYVSRRPWGEQGREQ